MSKSLSAVRPKDGTAENVVGASTFSEAQLDFIRDWLANPGDQAAETSPSSEGLAASGRAHDSPDDASKFDAQIRCSHLESGETSERPAPEPARCNAREQPESEGAAFEPDAPVAALRATPRRTRQAKGLEGKPAQSGPLLRQQRVSHPSSLPPAEPPRFLNVQNVAHRYNVSVATIWRAVADGSFPMPRKVMRKATRWAVVDLDAYDRAMAQP